MNSKKTFLKYVPLELFYGEYIKFMRSTHSYYYYCYIDVPFVKFICYYALYPNTEKLLKIGLSDFVCHLVCNRPMKRYINWNAQKPKDMFDMNKAQFKDFREHYYGMIDFQTYQILKKVKKDIPYYTVAAYVNEYAGESAVKVANVIKMYKLNVAHTFNYLAKQQKLQKSKSRYDNELVAAMWTDYLKFASELKYDLTREDILFPKKLQDAHDEASANITVKHDAEAFEKYKIRYEKLKRMYEYSNGKYEIVIPVGVNDIVEEGKALCHCVKGYAARHMEGQTTILFMRNCKRPTARLVTIEVNDNKKQILQNRGKSNRSPSKAEQQFIKEWIAWVQAGSKRTKKKKAAKGAA